MKRTVGGSRRVWLSLVSIALAGAGAAALATVRAAEAPNARGGSSRQGKQQAPPSRPLTEQEASQNPDLPGQLVAGGEIDMEAYLVGRQDHIDALQGLPYTPPKGQANPRLDAIKQLVAAEKAQRARLAPLGLAPPDWLEIGPAPIPNGQTPSPGATSAGQRAHRLDRRPPDEPRHRLRRHRAGRRLPHHWTAAPLDADLRQRRVPGHRRPGPRPVEPRRSSTWAPASQRLSADSFFGVGLYRIDNAGTTAD